MTRQEAIAELSQDLFDSIAEDPHSLDTFILEIIEFGHKGFTQYTNEELIEAFVDRFGDEVEIEN